MIEFYNKIYAQQKAECWAHSCKYGLHGYYDFAKDAYVMAYYFIVEHYPDDKWLLDYAFKKIQ